MPQRSLKSQAELTGPQKAAILLVELGSEVSAEVYKELSEEEIEEITLEIATLGSVTQEVNSSVFEEFYHTAMAKEYISKGGIDLARDILERAVGQPRAVEIISRLQGALQVSPFDFIKKVDPANILNFIQNEHPQTISLILAYLEPEQASQILSALPAEVQTEVAARLATMDRTMPEIIQEVESVLEQKIASVLSQEFTAAGGVEALADILNRVDRSTEKLILETLEERDQELAEEVKKIMFVFEDIVLLDDRSIQMVLKDVDQKDLSLALRASSEDVKNKIFSNLSQRAGESIREDMEFMGPVRIRTVEESQQRIVNTIRRLEEAGEIFISHGGEEDVLV